MKQIIANYDEEGIFVYQAFKPKIVQNALKKGTFGTGFNRDRMTWIKPSFGWMLHRSKYATKHRQEAILKIKISHEGFVNILSQSIETYFREELFSNEEEWRIALKNSEVRHQWDPDRDLRGYKVEQRAIQIGILGETVARYVDEWIISLEEVTSLAHQIHQAVKGKANFPSVPQEEVYEVNPKLQQHLGIGTKL